ncbi:MAG: T9SS C-terminal target domain-containing protein [Bacteroidia bacterium]|nr:MAG: T9SS C-terminal target domain-containing protein [Bacteroidia bacterium]
MFFRPHRVLLALLCCYLLCAKTGLPVYGEVSVVINEVMSSNATTFADEDGDYEDWIELYNGSDHAIHLQGYGLSDDYGNPFRWVFPDVTIAPGDFLLIWASGKNRNNPDAPLHTNFSISSAGEEVLITHPDGTRADELAPVHIPTDISYGRQPDGSDEWFYFSTPTPGESNLTEGAVGLLEAPVFSLTGGFFADEQQLEIHHPMGEEATIVFTADGSEPCIHNLEGTSYQYKNDYPFYPDDPFGDFMERNFRSFLYEDAITLADRTDEENKLAVISATVQNLDEIPGQPVFTGNVIRARAFKEGFLPGEIITHSYFISPEGAEKFQLPVISVVTSENHLFDYDDGIYTPGVDADQWRIDHPGEVFTWPYHGNFRRRGFEWEYPAHIEFFEHPGKERALGQNTGIRIHGGATRSYPNKSLRVYARNMYSDSHLDYPFFGVSGQAYKRLILRNSGNDFPTSIWRPDYPSRTMFRDAAIQKTVAHMRFDTQDYRPAILFINGEYWGIQNIRERYDKHYLERNYGVDPENLDILTGKDEAKEGDNLHFNETISYIEAHGVEDDQHYQWVLTRIDEQNFMDYQIANIYADNTDWPGNNIDFWRLRTDGYHADAPYGHDGRWRWMLFDLDFGFGLVTLGDGEAYEHNTLDFATTPEGSSWPNPPWSTFLLRTMLKNEAFRNQFINRFADQLNTAFLPERVTTLIYEMEEAIAFDIENHFARWGYPDAYDDWLDHVQVMVGFAENRPFWQRQHIMEYFDIQDVFNLYVDVDNQLMGHVKVNTIDIREGTPGVDAYPYPWQGKYFMDIPIEVKAVAAPGFTFSHWEGTHAGTENPLLIQTSDDVHLRAHFLRIEEDILIHYWLFDTRIPNDTPLEELDAFYGVFGGGVITYESALAGYPFDEHHPLWRKASMERRNQPTAINYRPEGNSGIPYHQSDMRGLQVRQPFREGERENTMVWHMPSGSFKDLVLRFAARDEGAADMLLIDYNVDDSGDTWSTEGLTVHTLPLGNAYQLYEIDFGHIEDAENNPHFKVRVRFDGDNMYADQGNRVTFNNISLEGKSLGAYIVHASADHNGSIYPAGNIGVYVGADLSFTITPGHNHRIGDVLVDGESMVDDLVPDHEGNAVFSFSNIEQNHTIHATFTLGDETIEKHEDRVVIYPNPADEIVHIAALEKILHIKVFKLNGQLIYERQNIRARSASIPLAGVRNGLYIVRIQTENQTVSQKLQVLR